MTTKFKFFFVLISLMLMHEVSCGQDGFGNHSRLFQHTPNSAKLGEFGKYEASPYSGQVDLRIPLVDFKFKDIVIPLSLKYNTAGNKVNEHPGSVGLGWTLMAGGAVVRVVKDKKDELTKLELIATMPSKKIADKPGYYFRGHMLYNDSKRIWPMEECLNHYVENDVLESNVDSEPDEFIFNFCGYSGSFYINPEGISEKKSVSLSTFIADVIPELSVDYPQAIPFFNLEGNTELSNYSGNMNLMTKSIKHFIGFTVILTNGDRYVFGGDSNSIEYISTLNENFHNTAPFHAEPTAWMLKKVVKTNGDIVNFEYKHLGTPYNASLNYYGGYYGEDPSKLQYKLSPYVHFSSINYLHPLYLSKIESGDGLNKIEFKYSKSLQLNQELDYTNFNNYKYTLLTRVCSRNGNLEYFNPNLLFEWCNYWMQLDDIIIDDKSKFHFNYTNNNGERLKLMSIEQKDIGGKTYGTYDFFYNQKKLPAYNTRETDNWGYYNGITYNVMDLDIEPKVGFIKENLYAKRKSDLLCTKAEILESIKYPTGGITLFDYQLNDYSCYVDKSSAYKLVNEFDKGGGLRISKIVNIDNNGDIVDEKEYKYIDERGISSGILSGKPTYSGNGSIYEKTSVSEWKGWCKISIGNMPRYYFKVFSEQSLSTLTLSNRNTITYSRVEEVIKGNGKKVYSFYNHDTILDEEPETVKTNGDGFLFFEACTSKEMERGKQKRIEIWNEEGRRTEMTDFFYKKQLDWYNKYLKAFVYHRYDYSLLPMYRISTYKIYTSDPYLQKKITTSYPEKGSTIVTEENYLYNNDNLISEIVTKQSDGKFLKTKKCYINDILPKESGGTIKRDRGVSLMAFDRMKNLSMISYPIEEVKSLISDGREQTVDVRINLYRLNNKVPVLSETKKLNVTSGITDYNGLKYLQEWNSPINRDYQYWCLKIDPRLFSMEQYVSYDTVKNNIQEVVDKSGIRTSYLWDYNGRNVIATANNMSYDSLLKLAGTAPNTTNETVLMDYLLKLRSKVDISSVHISTYTYHPHLGLTSTTNPQGVTTTYNYDSIGRLSNVLQCNKLIASYDYNFRGQLTTNQNYGNDLIVRIFNRNTCPIGATGSSVIYSIPSDQYFSKSKLEANAQALAEVDLKGQNYANEKGSCIYSNDFMERNFTKRCPLGGIGDQVTYTVPFGKHTSIVNKEEANAKAKADIDANGQAYANDRGVCSFYNEAKSKTFTRNDCPSNAKGNQVTYIVPAGKYTSTISQDDANEKALEDVNLNGQEYANRTGTCTMIEKEPIAGEPNILYSKESLGNGNIAELGVINIYLKGNWKVYVEGNFSVVSLTGGRITSGYGSTVVRVIQNGPVLSDFDFAGKINFVGSGEGFTCIIQ